MNRVRCCGLSGKLTASNVSESDGMKAARAVEGVVVCFSRIQSGFGTCTPQAGQKFACGAIFRPHPAQS